MIKDKGYRLKKLIIAGIDSAASKMGANKCSDIYIVN
jgi:hypothetical protein